MPYLTDEQAEKLLMQLFDEGLIIPATQEEVEAIEAEYRTNPVKSPYEGLPPWWDEFCRKHGIH